MNAICTRMDKDFHTFLLEQRKLDEAVIATFINEKIDCISINGMTDEELSNYVPKFGDRLAIRQFCGKEAAVLQETTTVSKASKSLMEKIKQRRASRSHGRSEKLMGNFNAAKKERAFQMGLFEEIEGANVQVKERRGGGTRHLKALKTTSMAELLETGKALFFPNGKSRLGDVSDFKFIMRDFTEEELDPTTTLGQQYEKRKVKTLRLYLSCKKIEKDTNDVGNDDATTPDQSQIGQTLTSSLGDPHSTFSENAFISPATPTSAFLMEHLPEPLLSSNSSEVSIIASVNLETWNVENYVTENYMDEEEFVIIEPQQPIRVDDEIVIGRGFMEDDSHSLDDTLPMDTVELESSVPVHEYVQPPKITKLRLHRGNVFQELNAALKNEIVSVNDSLLEIEMVQPNGFTEKGEDNGGVLRDALSEYWETFFLKCTSGNTIKIPLTRHDMKDEWVHIAKVMVLGYNIVKYFPICLPKPFLFYCLGLEVTDDDLFSSFLGSVSSEEKEVAELAMKNYKEVSATEEWLDFLEAHDVKVLVTEANVRKTLLEVAHKELVQDPAYIAECWSSVLKELRLPQGGLNKVMASLTPTPRKVVSLLQHETLNPRESQTLDFLKRFIRNCTDVRLKRFLRFCTGADLIVVQKIQLRFIEPESTFSRRPVSHTCGCVLEVPNNYVSYPELAEEFANILDANMWVMDII